MDIVATISSQYLAALEMLKQTISQCPESIWDSAEDKNRSWHIAHHVLFYTHLYLQDTERSFTPWHLHRRDSQFLGRYPWPPHDPVVIGEPYDKATVLEYLAFCQQQVAERAPATDFEAASGFDWLPFDKLELQFYNIRHLQQHTGELMERLGTRAGVELDWVGMKRG